MWVRDSLHATSLQQAVDVIGQKVDDYEWGLKKHGFKAITGTISQVFAWKEAMVSAMITAAVAKALGPLWAAIAGGVMVTSQIGTHIAEQLIDREDAKRGKDREVAIIHEIKKRFGKPR